MKPRTAQALVGWTLLVVIGGITALILWGDLDRQRAGEELAWQSPYAFLLLFGCLLMGWVQFHLRARRSATFFFSRVYDLGLTRPGWAARLAPLPAVFRICAVGLIAVALARPQTYKEEERKVEGIDIMIVLDLSKSMEETDLRLNRLDAGQRTIRRFVSRRDADRIGLVVFAREALLQCPLTLDYGALDQIVADLMIGDVPELGTAIGDATGLALAQLRRSEARSKIIILVSDGDSNVASKMDPEEATALASTLGVRVFTVLVGREDGRHPFGSTQYAANPELLQNMARDTGGAYFRADDDAALEASFEEIRQKLDKTEMKVVGRSPNKELYHRFLIPAVAFLLLELLDGDDALAEVSVTEFFGSVPWAWTAVGVLVALTLLHALDFTRRRRQIERIGYSPMLQRMTASLSHRRRIFRSVLLTLGATGVVASLAHPQGRGETVWQQRGIDVALVLDYSKSMLAKDVYQNRLQRMNVEVEELTRKLKSDRIGTVVFAGSAIHFPLTHDHKAARVLWDRLSPADLPPGSDMGEALRVARCILRPDVVESGCGAIGGRGQGGAPLGPDITQQAVPPPPRPDADELDNRARAIVLFTDGEDTENRARAEVEEAVRLGIDVYVVGVGTLAGELVPEIDERGNVIGWKKLPDGSFVTTRLDQAKLKELAEVAGGEGHYYVLDSKTNGLDDLIARLQRLKEGNLDERAKKTFEERYQWVLFPAFLLLLIEACISERRRRASPSGQPAQGAS